MTKLIPLIVFGLLILVIGLFIIDPFGVVAEKCKYNVYCGENQTGFDIDYSAVVSLTQFCVVEKDMGNRVCVTNECNQRFYDFEDCNEERE